MSFCTTSRLSLALIFQAGMLAAPPTIAATSSTVPLTKNQTATNPVAQTTAKTAKKRNLHHYHYKTYFVPPPPAYMPSILPELTHRGNAQQTNGELAQKPENPYKKYIHTPGGDAPEPVQVRKGVVTWTPHS